MRRERGWSQSELASRLSELGMQVHATGVTRLESGARGISLNEACLLAVVFDLTPEDLIASLRTEAEVGMQLEARLTSWESDPPGPEESLRQVELLISVTHEMVKEAVARLPPPGPERKYLFTGEPNGEHPEA